MDKIFFEICRYMIIFQNLVVIKLAGFLIYVSFSAMDQDFGMDTLKDNHPKVFHAHISAISAGVGVIIVILSALGFYGALRRSKSVLAMYAAIVLFMVSLLAFLAVFTFTVKPNGNTHRDVDRSIVNATISLYKHTDSRDIKTRLLDNTQRWLSCCGINNPNDWKDYGLKLIPKSCCSDFTEFNQPPLYYCAEADYKIGCWKAMTDYFYGNLSKARTILYLMIADGILCSLAAFFMVRTINRSLEVV